ncbi:uncharacterized protein LOC106052027 isoform X2 [Biomphalaria glabrata]|uniref:Uncharacterized protein LOC106052027 isoform X2 n=1 Tax=Biomphalaria glabrata TaxID=6526 RepID=A0A9W3AVK4_BIOGL|nr:uncharacterized protein LOC106052027 isoform X2 [Biomphalaria glabrata]
MAYGHDWLVQSASFFWIFTLMLSESQSKRTQLYFMDESDCGNTKTVGGALVYSHSPSRGDYYPHDIDCQITFEAESGDFKLMMRVIEMDLPDRTATGKCNDALYVYDANTFLARAMEHAGGAGGLCGSLLPSTLKSTGPHLTVVFKTDSDGPVGRGFKFIITAYSEDDKKSNNCGSSFECDNKMCIPMSLTCDGTDNCGDYSDEAGSGRAKCKEECAFICRFLSLGVTASIFISVGSIVIVVSCVVALICCCRRTLCRKNQELATCGSAGVVTTTTAVLTNGTAVSSSVGSGSRAPSAFSNHGYTHQGYYPMQPVYPANHGSLYSYAKDPFAPQGPAFSSQQHQQHHRSYTPTSSKSGRSNKSNNSTSVTYSQGTEKVSIPVNL